MNESVLRMLEAAGAVITNDHLVYTSGKHGSAYVNKDALYLDGEYRQEIAHQLAHPFSDETVELVIGPAIGGAILAMYVADKLYVESGQRALSVYAEKQPDGTFSIKRGFDALVLNKRVLVVEDILTTGASALGVVTAARACGGTVIGVSAICNRGEVTAAMLGEVPKLVSILDLPLETWPEEDCPLCKQDMPVNTQLGKGREFLAKRQNG